MKHGIEIAVREFIQALGLGPEKPRAWKRYDLTKEERSEVFKGGVGFSFKLDSVDLGDGIKTSKTVWSAETYQATADDVLTDNSEHGAIAEAKEFLRESTSQSEIRASRGTRADQRA